MMWNSETAALSACDAIADHIATRILDACACEVPPHPLRVAEVAKGVASFLAPPGTRTRCVESRQVLALASRALQAVGEETLARRLIVFGTGLVRRESWLVCGAEPMWVLDVGRLTARRDDCLELTVFGSLDLVLDAVAEVWDVSGGRGVLGLDHVRVSVNNLLGGSPRRNLHRDVRREIRLRCAGRLECLGKRRGWGSVPFVLNLDP